MGTLGTIKRVRPRTLTDWALHCCAMGAAGATCTLTDLPAQSLPELPGSVKISAVEAQSALPFLTDNARCQLDFSVRSVFREEDSDIALISAVGVDYHKVVTDGNRDIGTFVVQGYLTRFDNAEQRPFFVEDAHDFEFVWRIVTFNANVLGDQTFNIEVGHIELPYGLEQLYDTNGTIWDFDLLRNVGVKTDWGAGINGMLETFDYDVTLTRGSGNTWDDTNSPFALTGRIGTPQNENLVLGLSAFHGETGENVLTRRTKVAADLSLGVDAFDVLAEVAVGRQDADDTVDSRFELDWRNNSSTLLTYGVSRARWRRFERDSGGWESAIQLGLGVQWQPGLFEWSAEFNHDLTAFGDTPRDTRLTAQVRVRF